MYIKDSICISPQATESELFFEQEAISYSGNKYYCIKPNYKSLIQAKQLRRLSNANKNSVYAGSKLINRNNACDGIIIATVNGSSSNNYNFLYEIFKYNEGNLTPTNFIQGAPNSTAGTLAQISKNHKYNITHVHEGLAFENALIDASMLLKDGSAKSLLLGNIEELSEINFKLDTLSHFYKNEHISSEELLTSNTKGTVCGEGTAMFILESEKNDNLVRIVDVDQTSFLSKNDVTSWIKQFLKKNDTISSNIDALILGFNGDNRTDSYYSDIIDKLFTQQAVYTYKNIVGEYPTSTAFACWLGEKILIGKTMPSAIKYKETDITAKNILIYNHNNGKQHALILLSR